MTPAAYIENLDEERKAVLLQLREMLFKLLPDAVENMHHNMPTYWISNHPVFALAGQKAYVVLYIIPYDLMEPFEQDLEKYKSNKTAIKVRRFNPALEELLEDIIMYCGTRFKSSALYNKMAGEREKGYDA